MFELCVLTDVHNELTDVDNELTDVVNVLTLLVIVFKFYVNVELVIVPDTYKFD